MKRASWQYCMQVVYEMRRSNAMSNELENTNFPFRSTRPFERLERSSELENWVPAKKLSCINITNSLNSRSPSGVVWAKSKRFWNRNLIDPSTDLINLDTIDKMIDLFPSICPPSCFVPNFPHFFHSIRQLDCPFSFSEL